MADIDTGAFRREWGGCGFTVTEGMTADPEDSCVSCVVQTLCAEIDRLRAERIVADGTATHWYGRWVEVSAERDEAVAARDRWRDSWESGAWSTEVWERERAIDLPPRGGAE